MCLTSFTVFRYDHNPRPVCAFLIYGKPVRASDQINLERSADEQISQRWTLAVPISTPLCELTSSKRLLKLSWAFPGVP